ncbi:anti-sigma factor domain-containing protein [Amycolatopsis halotolerans]|uniref:Regulator of SigK n=1 Tax=Amycolatopsis halotolerans TaxID=330083 RepID=A0ABV7QLY1_9PSEU
MTAPDLHVLTGAYALDAVTGLERAAFDRHLGECPVCAHEVQEFRETAGILGAAAAEGPPGGFRDRVLATITTTRQLPPDVDPVPSPEPRAHRTWRSRTGIAVAAVAAAAAVLFGGISIGLHETDPGPAQVAAPADPRGAPDATTVHGDGTSGAAANATLSRQLGLVTVQTRHLPALGSGQAYQFWLMGPRGPQSAGLLRTGDGTITAALPPDTDRIGVTVEPATGSPQPTTAPILLVGLA